MASDLTRIPIVMANEVGKAQCWNPSGIVVYRGVFKGVQFVKSSLEKDMIQGDNPVFANCRSVLDTFGESSCLGMQLKAASPLLYLQPPQPPMSPSLPAS